MTAKIWNDLGDVVLRLVDQRLTEGEEFRALMAYYGREKLLAEYKRARERQKKEQEKDGNDLLPPGGS